MTTNYRPTVADFLAIPCKRGESLLRPRIVDARTREHRRAKQARSHARRAERASK